MLSLFRAWRTDKSAVQFLSSLCERLPTEARGRVDISTPNPPIRFKIYLILVVVRCYSSYFFFSLPLVGYEHDVAVNHVSVSRQLCQAEEECPLLARWRPVGSSEGASLGRVRRLRCGGNLFFILFFKLLLLTCSLHIFSSVRYYFRYHMSMHARDLNKSLFVQSSVF